MVAYTDSFSKIEWYNNRPFINLNNLHKIDFDFILIAVQNENARKKIVDDLRARNYDINQIIDLYRISKVDRIMLNTDTEDVWEGIVLGISYGDAGINTHYFRKRMCNLAVPGLDIYGNYMSLKKCLENYKEKINLKYCIFDMFDYSYFAYDMSLSEAVKIHLLCRGGEKLVHNIMENKNIETVEKEFLINFCNHNNDTNLYKKIFKETDYVGVSHWGHRKQHIQDIEYSIEENALGRRRNAKYQKTIEENIYILEKIFQLLRENYPDIRIILLRMPMFYRTNRVLADRSNEWKEDFINILDGLRQKYDFEYYDFRELEIISKNPYFWWDLAHLNVTGSIAFTSYLDKLLFDEKNNIINK